VGTKDRSTRSKSDGFLAGVDQIRVLLTRVRISTETQDTVFGLENNLNALGQEGRSDKRHTDTQVDVHAILEFLGGALDDAFTSGSGITVTYSN
jgi:hypothetical protein